MSRFFIDRPIVAMVISIVIVIAGLVTLQGLPIAQFPDIVPPEVMVQTTYTGADAPTIEQAVATPLEQQINGVDNMIYVKSTNANDGTMTIRVDFEVGTDVNMDQVLVQNRVSQATAVLPVDVKNYGVTVQKSLSTSILIFSLYSPHHTYDRLFLSNYANVNINDSLLRVPGIGQVTVYGAANYAMRCWVKPDELAKLGLTVNDLIAAIQKQNVVNPAGQIGAEPAPPGQEFTYSVRSQGRLIEAEEFGGIIVRAHPDGSIVRLKDVARLELGSQLYNQTCRMNGAPAAAIGIFQTPGSNALDVARGAKTVMAELKKSFPDDLDYAVSLDTTLAVTEGINEIVETLGEALVLVILVVFLFLQTWRATLIPLLTVPVSLIGTFALFPLLGFSINTLSLFGLVLAIGLVVDDAIVVVEAVERQIEQGLSPREATLKAMSQVSGPVIAIALILSAVFIPVAFMKGITGRLYQQFALTIAISVLISAFNALTLSPALAALILKPRHESRGPLGAFFGRFNRWFDRATNGYVGISSVLVRKTVRTAIFLVVVGLGAAGLSSVLPTGFVPEEDQGYLYTNVLLPDAASLQRTDAVCRKIEAIFERTPGVAHYVTVGGYSSLAGVSIPYNGFFFVSLTPWEERRTPELEAASIIASLNRQFAAIPEAQVFAYAPPAIRGIGSSGGFDLMLQDRSGGSIEFLARNVDEFLAAARRRPELGVLNNLFRARVPQLFARVDKDKVLKLGVDIQEVYAALQSFLGGYYVNDFNRFGRQWKVYLQSEASGRMRPEDVGRFYVRNRSGEMVPLSTVVKMEEVNGPEFTNRFNLFRAAEITGSAAPGYSTGQAMDAIEAVAREVLPREMGYAWSGMSYQEKEASGSATGILALSLLFVFLILAALYESWSLPFSVLLGTPIAVFGALLGIWARHFDNNVFVQIGLIMLVGLGAKNAILIVEFARSEIERGQSVLDAALAGARLRLRPILMTAFAFILGCVPLWLADGSGAVARKVLGTAVVTGMLATTLIGIFIIPVLFVVVERIVGRRRKHTLTSAAAIMMLVMLASSCAVGPNYKRPEVTPPAAFRGQVGTSEAASFADLPWWEVFEDETLKGLIETALQNNYDLLTAIAHIEQARAQVGAARADFFPQVDYEGQAARGEGLGQTGVQAMPGQTGNAFYGLFNLTWEADLWGRIRRSNQAARAELLASEENRRAVALTLVAAVAQAYFELRELDLELEIAQRTVESFRSTLNLFEQQRRGGVASRLDTARAEAALAAAAATIPDLEGRIFAKENEISILLGRNPESIPRGTWLEDHRSLPSTPAGLPSALLERRPDIREAEQNLIAANALVGVAVANFFPKIGLTTVYGSASPEIENVIKGNPSIWGVAGAMTGPLFQGGRLLANRRSAIAQWEQTRLAYQQTVIRAFQEVSNTLVRQQKLALVREQQARAVASLRDSVDISTKRYSGGLADYYEVLEAQQQLFPAENSLAQTRRDQLIAVVTLYQALGGGWSLDAAGFESPTRPQATCGTPVPPTPVAQGEP